MPLAPATPGRTFVYVSSSEVQTHIGWTGAVPADDTILQMLGRYYSQGATDLFLYGIDSAISGSTFTATAILHIQRAAYLASLWSMKLHIAMQVSNNTYNAINSYNTNNAPSAAEKIGWVMEDEWWNNGYDDFIRIRDLTTTWQPFFIASGTEYGPYTGFTKDNGDSYGEDFSITAVSAAGAITTFTTSVNHGFIAGGSCEIVGVTGFANNPNGQFVMTAASGNQFQISHIAGAGAYGGGAFASSVYTGPGEIAELQGLFTNWYIHDYVLVPRYSQMRNRLLQFTIPVNVAPIPSMESTTAVPPQLNNFSGNFRMGQDPGGVVTYTTKSWEQCYQYICIDTQALGLLPNQSGTPRYFNLETDPGILANITMIGIVIFSGSMERGRPVTNGARIMVYAGADQTFGSTFGIIALSDAYVYDDWLPPPGGVMTYTWSVISGPPGYTIANFSNANALNPSFTFSAPSLGGWVLQLSAFDGITTTTDQMALVIEGVSGGMTITLTEDKAPTCTGDCDAEATVTIAGGVAPYTVVWSSGTLPLTHVTGLLTDTQTGLCSGLVTVTVTDSTGGTPLSATESITVSSPAPLVITLSSTNPLCPGGATGTITMVVTGGSFGIASTDWTKDAVAIFPADPYNLVNLTLGFYEVTVTDNGGCVRTASVRISEPTAMTATAVITDPSCFGAADGSISITVSDGTPGYSYSWLDPNTGLAFVPPQIASKIYNLAADNYTVVVTDANGCTQNFVFSVVDPDAIVVTVTPIGPTDLCLGAATVDFQAQVVSGGTPPYIYQWSPAAGLTPSATVDYVTFTPVVAGPYTFTCTVTDALGCQGFATVGGTVIASFDVLPILQVSGVLGSCPGASVTVTVTNAGSFGSFLWQPDGQTTDSIVVDYEGTFTVLAYDPSGSGCYTTASVEILITPTTIQLIGVTDNSCGGDNDAGAINITTFGGCPAYTWEWTDVDGNVVGTSEDISGLATGQYTVVATDSLGQTASKTYNVYTDSPEIAISFTNIDGSTGGTATATVTGGTAPYVIVWLGPDGTTYSGATITDLFVEGIYRVTVTDANGCTASDIVCISRVYSFGMSECEFKCFLQQMSCCQADMVYRMTEAAKGGKEDCVQKVALMETFLEMLECYYPEGTVVRAGKKAYYMLTINSYSNGGTLVIVLLGDTIVNYTFNTGFTFEQNLDNIVALVVAAGLTASYETDGSSYATLIINAPTEGAGYNCVTMTVTNTSSNIEVLTTRGFTGGVDELIADPPCLTDDEINHIMEQMRCICGCDCTNLTTLTDDTLNY